MQLNNVCMCDVCKKPIETSIDGRVEWINRPGNRISDIHVCHNECSSGYNNAGINVGDIIFKETYIYGGAQYIYNRLDELEENNPDVSHKVQAVRINLFG